MSGDGAAVERDELDGLVEPVRRDVPDVDRQLDPGDVRTGELQRMRQHRGADPPAARRRRQPEIRDLPGVAVGDLGQEQDGRRVALVGDPAEPPSTRDESARGAVAREDVVERPDPFELGHVEAVLVRRLQGGAELGLNRRPVSLPVQRGDARGDRDRLDDVAFEVDQVGHAGHPAPRQVGRAMRRR